MFSRYQLAAAEKQLFYFASASVKNSFRGSTGRFLLCIPVMEERNAPFIKALFFVLLLLRNIQKISEEVTSFMIRITPSGVKNYLL